MGKVEGSVRGSASTEEMERSFDFQIKPQITTTKRQQPRAVDLATRG